MVFIPGQRSKVKAGVTNLKTPAYQSPDHMTRFRLRAKILFLTYSQVQDDVISELRDSPRSHFTFIEEVLGTPCDYRLSRESHSDGAAHLHCVLGYDETKLVNSASLLDYRGTHPNIKSIRGTIKKPWNYAGKDGDIIYELGGPDQGDRGTGGSIAERWSHAIDAATEDDFFERVRMADPRSYVLFNRAIVQYAHKVYRKPREYTSPRFRLLGGSRIEGWLSQSDLGRRGGER